MKQRVKINDIEWESDCGRSILRIIGYDLIPLQPAQLMPVESQK